VLEGGVGNILLDGEVFRSIDEGNFGSVDDGGLARATFGSWGVAKIIVPIAY
jgi:hypothetical protein